MTPTINVNLRHCDTPHLCAENGGEHVPVCAARPVLIPCPIPRSVTFEVVLGLCDYPRDACRFGHLDGCPARPVKVVCTISGKTWEESEVEDVETGE